jgi:hypothetical protein
MPNRLREDSTRGRALDLWQAPKDAGEPLSCLATTYTFDAAFFETECLGRFLQMETHPQESETVSYLIEREEKLAAARACVLVDRHHAQEKESLRWDVLPVIVPRAVQHAKIGLLCWARQVRLIVGSGNLTEPGYRKNVEIFGALDASPDRPGPVDAILQCIDFLERMVEHAAGRDAGSGPKPRAREILSAVRRHIQVWPRERARRARVMVIFGGIGQSVVERVRKIWPASSPPRNLAVLSPFFDSDDASNAAWTGASSLLAKRGERVVEFFAAAERLPDGRTRLFAPRSLVDAARASCETDVWQVESEQEGEMRPLHAKGFYLSNGDWALFLFGSSNFTRAGLSLNPAASNFEANLAYLTRDGEPDVRHLDRVWPEWSDDPVDLDDPAIVWDPAIGDDGEADIVPALPAAFEEALYQAGEEPRLLIRLLDGLPATWSIRTPDGTELLSSLSWSGSAGERAIDWAQRPVPFLLTVSWQGSNQVCTAAWPVNVSEPGSLPPPDCLRELSLEELIDVLGSTRPLHVAVAHVLRRRAKSDRGGVVLDPLKRVNTETFLLRRTKRVATALERVRERLERPAFSIDAFLWRLRGPLGAIGLAAAFQREARTPAEARFFLVELALSLRRIDIAKAAVGGIDAAAGQAAVSDAIAEIEQMAGPAAAGGSPLDEYVRAGFVAARG